MIKYTTRKYLPRKKVDDVLGGETAWENVEATEGKQTSINVTIQFKNYFLIKLTYFTKLNVKTKRAIPTELTLCSSRFEVQTSQ